MRKGRGAGHEADSLFTLRQGVWQDTRPIELLCTGPAMRQGSVVGQEADRVDVRWPSRAAGKAVGHEADRADIHW